MFPESDEKPHSERQVCILVPGWIAWNPGQAGTKKGLMENTENCGELWRVDPSRYQWKRGLTLSQGRLT